MSRAAFRRLGGVTLVAALLVTPLVAQGARREKVVELSEVVERLREAERVVVAAERAAAADDKKSEEALAKRLVEGQLKLAERDVEAAAIIFLDLIENYPQSEAAPQALYFLGEALVLLDMHRWAAELFSRNLGDSRTGAMRFRQRSVARLLDLRFPRREEGFARSPGISATPEAKARLAALGLEFNTAPPTGVIGPNDAKRLERWAESFTPANREPELRYAYGRYLYLSGHPERAQAELDAISPIDLPLTRGGPEARWRLRAAYVAAAATAALKEVDDALERFARITNARPTAVGDRQIMELAWMAMGRVHHDERDWDDAVRAYREVGRDSPFFSEAMYETAWTLLRAGRFDRAQQGLDLLLVYDPDSPIAPEIKQLRGKLKIQQRDYKAAEDEFLALRREFDGLAQRLEGRLKVKEDVSRYFAAVIGEDMEHFSLGSLLPAGAISVAQSLPRAMQAEDMTRDVGHLEEELRDTRALLSRMEEAIRAKERARLFTDLGAHLASVDTVVEELVDVESDLVRRSAARKRPRTFDELDEQRRQLQAGVDNPLGKKGQNRAQVVEQIQLLSRAAHKLGLTLAAQRAQLVAAERYYDETRNQQKIDHKAFLSQAAELRDAIAKYEDELADLENRIQRAEGSLRYNDPYRDAKVGAVARYRQHVERMYGALGAVDPETRTLWERAKRVEKRAEAARRALDRTAGLRLRHAMRVLVEERANLDQYLTEWRVAQAKTKGLVANVMAASYRDVVGELRNLVLRSEVGLLDVAWSMKEFEQAAVERLETQRSRDIQDLDRTLQSGLEDLER